VYIQFIIDNFQMCVDKKLVFCAHSESDKRVSLWVVDSRTAKEQLSPF